MVCVMQSKSRHPLEILIADEVLNKGNISTRNTSQFVSPFHRVGVSGLLLLCFRVSAVQSAERPVRMDAQKE